MTMSHCVNAFQQICNGSASTTEKKKSTIMLSVVAEPFSDDPSGMHFASVFTLSLSFSLSLSPCKFSLAVYSRVEGNGRVNTVRGNCKYW